MSRIAELQQLIKMANSLHIDSALLDYAGVVEYYPEELVMTMKAGTKIKDIQAELAKNNQALPFFVGNAEQSIGAAYAQGAQDLSDSVLGVRIIDGRGDLLNFGGQVLKNVAGYDVARLLVGSKGQLALVVEISFKVVPHVYIKGLKAAVKSLNTSALHQKIKQQLKSVFDPQGIFQ